MNRNGGFTLLEMMVVVMILGILAATAFPTYQTIHSRAVGAEASTMMKQLLDGEITHYLEHDRFFPDAGLSVTIRSDGTESPAGTLQDLKEALKIQVPTDRHLDYEITNQVIDGDNICLIRIESSDSKPLFKGGDTGLYAVLDKEGRITYLSIEGLLAALGG